MLQEAYLESLTSGLPKGLAAARLSERPALAAPLQRLCGQIAEQKKDKRYLNYSRERFCIERQLEISLLVSDNNEILSFASLQERAQFPKGFARAMSRSWKDPRLRSALYHKKLTLILLGLQIKSALEKSGISHIFISAEGPRRQWWKKWIQEANKLYPGWRLCPQMAQVCSGPISLCYQSLVSLKLRKGNGANEGKIKDDSCAKRQRNISLKLREENGANANKMKGDSYSGRQRDETKALPFALMPIRQWREKTAGGQESLK